MKTCILALIGSAVSIQMNNNPRQTLVQKKTYPILDARSWIEPYNQRDHAWNIDDSEKANRYRYCSSAPDGYDVNLDCEFYYDESDEKKNLTFVNKFFLKNITKELVKRDWYFGKQLTDRDTNYKFSFDKSKEKDEQKTWKNKQDVNDTGRWDLYMTKQNDTMLRFYRNRAIINMKLDATDPEIIFKAGEQDDASINNAQLFSVTPLDPNATTSNSSTTDNSTVTTGANTTDDNTTTPYKNKANKAPLNNDERAFVGKYDGKNAAGEVERSYVFAENRTFVTTEDAKLGAWELKTDRDGTYVRLVWGDEDDDGASDGTVIFNLTRVRPVTFSVMNTTHTAIRAGYKLVKEVAAATTTPSTTTTTTPPVNAQVHAHHAQHHHTLAKPHHHKAKKSVVHHKLQEHKRHHKRAAHQSHAQKHRHARKHHH